jgi:hypothetical protein
MKRRRFDRAWLALVAAISFAVTLLNFYAEHGFHTIEKHLVFRERILHGFSIADVPWYPIPPTFPMWGYGFVLLLTTNKVALIAIQMAIALWSAWHLLATVDMVGLLTERTRILLRLLIVVCAPWYAYHSIDWSQSLATSLLVVSVSLLIRACHTGQGNWRALCVSAVCLGLNLNLASDLYLLPFFLAATYWWCAGRSRQSAARAGVWLGMVAITLAPWMFYTWRAVGAPLVKSTNQGHVLLIGLGQDPQKRFGTTYSDEDPLMYGLLRRRLGDEFAARFYASCSYEADLVLRPAFFTLVAAHPRAYLDLVFYKLTRMLTGDVGTYDGEYDVGRNVGAFGIGAVPRFVLRRYTQEFGHWLQFGTTVFAPVVFWAWIRRRQVAWAFVLVTIAYQYGSLAIASLEPQYVSNLILFQLLVCAGGVDWIARAALRVKAPLDDRSKVGVHPEELAPRRGILMA